MPKLTLPSALLLVLTLLIPFYAFSLTTFTSASASALSGITLLSENPADHAYSPLIGASGFCASWSKPFGLSDTTLLGMHSAFGKGILSYASGLNYLANPDYRWQDEYLAIGLNLGGLKAGVTQHLIYEKIASDSWFTWDNDFALAAEGKEYATELRYNNSRSQDASLSLSAASGLHSAASFCSAYTWTRSEKGFYSLASVYRVAEPLQLQCSWQSDPGRFGFGVLLNVGGVKLNYAVQTHPELSLSHSLDLGFAW